MAEWRNLEDVTFTDVSELDVSRAPLTFEYERRISQFRVVNWLIRHLPAPIRPELTETHTVYLSLHDHDPMDDAR